MLITLVNLNQGLRVDKINNAGFYEEPLGEAKLFDHYHNFLFFINLTKLEVVFSTLVNNSVELSNNKKVYDLVSLKVVDQLKLNLEVVKAQFYKLVFRRSKRGITNGLGSIVKFITGNLDDNDLLVINQDAEIEKIISLLLMPIM